MKDELRYKNSFRKFSDENLLIYGIILVDQSFFLKEFHVGKINISIKEVEFDDSNVKVRSVIFNFQFDKENELFIFLLDSFIKSNSDGVTSNDIIKLIKVLKSLSINNLGDYYGLVGECIFIYDLIKKGQIDQLNSWHRDLNDIYDFVQGDTIYEIKTTTGNIRKHSLKYLQHKLLMNDFREHKFYVSIVISKYSLDHTLSSLVREIEKMLFGKILSEFKSKISKYDDRLFEISEKFDLNETLNSILYMDVNNIGDISIENKFVDTNNLSIPVFFDLT